MQRRICARFLVILLLLQLQLITRVASAPAHNSNDIDYNDSSSGSGGSGGVNGNALGNLLRGNYNNNNNNNNTPMDYNMLFTHVKDFFMYLPVMMTTLRESMSGFPKFAEGIRILTSKNGRLEGSSECNCDKNSNEIDSRQFG